MNCPNCGSELVWGSDIDVDTDLETDKAIPLIKNRECTRGRMGGAEVIMLCPILLD